MERSREAPKGPGMKREKAEKIQVIDVIRGVAILQVLADHYFKVAVPDLALAPPVHFSDRFYQEIVQSLPR